MELPANKPAAGVSVSPNPPGNVPVAAESETVPPVQRVTEVTPPERDLQHTQQAIAEQVSRYLNSSTRNLEFHVDNESGNAVIVVRDMAGNVIRRIPGEEALQRMLRASAESGTLIDSTA
jgi:uncharacterized FlaG/YvyC family protein